jgi:hypothetical protein
MHNLSLCPNTTRKNREMILDAAETALGLFGFDSIVYRNFKKKERRKWYRELRGGRTRDIRAEAIME